MLRRFYIWAVGILCAISCYGQGWHTNPPALFAQNFCKLPFYFFRPPTFKLFAATAPFYSASHALDEPIHRKFYDDATHTNLRQPPHWLNHAGDWLVLPLSLGLMVYELQQDEKGETAWTYGAGLVACLIGKDLIKKIPHGDNVRPFNERFPKKKVYGGFPSGHTVFAAYMTTFFAGQYGWKWGAPLALFAAGSCTVSIVSNRHYLSQVIAGAVFGVGIGLAANAIVAEREHSCQTISYGIELDEAGSPAITFSYSY